MEEISQLPQHLESNSTAEVSDVMLDNVMKLAEATKDWERVSEQLSQSVTEAVIGVSLIYKLSFRFCDVHIQYYT